MAANRARDPTKGSQTLNRGLCILSLLAGHQTGMTVSELAEELQVDRAIVYRLLSTLAAHRLVARTRDGRFELWTGLVELARGVGSPWRTVAEPALRELTDDLQSTSTLTVATGDVAEALLVVEPSNATMHVAYRPGSRHPLDRGAAGKAILLGRPAVSGEPRDVTRARRRGWIVTRGELQAGATGIAAPILVDGWADASVGVIALDSRLQELLGTRVLRCAETVAAALPTPRP